MNSEDCGDINIVFDLLLKSRRISKSFLYSSLEETGALRMYIYLLSWHVNYPVKFIELCRTCVYLGIGRAIKADLAKCELALTPSTVRLILMNDCIVRKYSYKALLTLYLDALILHHFLAPFSLS